MLFHSTLFTPMPQAKSEPKTAWHDGYWETHRLNYDLPAVRIHSRFRDCGGRWFAVDLYNVSAAEYQRLMALVARVRGGACRPVTLRHPHVDYYILPAGTIVNVGVAAKQGYHPGGGLQFQIVTGRAVFLEEEKDPKRVQF